MLGKLTLRTKALIGIAVACAGYIVMMPDTSQTIEPTRSAATPASGAAASGGAALGATAPGASVRAIQPAPSGRKSTAIKAPWSGAARVVKDTAAADLFSAHSWYVAPPPPPPAPVVYTPPPAPTAPPLPFVFMGSFRTDTGGAIYYLTAGDRVYDVKVGDTLDNTYSVDGVKSGQLLLTYMPLKIQQTLAVGDE
ncbi:MAG TPA: hypothetical protein VK803_03085 [Steroidobacteraceae bacterium]|jgi:hypothetical protein|nr:hypothetical protein [Steroidobacteraceae bacterium]